MDKITLFLQKIDFSQYFSDEELADIVKSLEIVALYPGDVIITEGEKGDALYLIQEGRLQVYKAIAPEESQVIAEVGAGKWIGELQVLLGGERMASVRAIEESQLIRFPKTEIIRLNAKYPALNEYFVKIALQNLKELKFTSLLYDFFGHIERSCILELQRSAEWIQLHRGDRLFAQGESGDSVYFLLNGLLNAVI
ncbi:MAG: cyclic nucleotide-binding domain-containing protein, partial [Okeania sp. SIO2H7]|nr:cyclic nucleotide-binding domain-containing protein [Okeania sp. SIO2H7]